MGLREWWGQVGAEEAARAAAAEADRAAAARAEAKATERRRERWLAGYKAWAEAVPPPGELVEDGVERALLQNKNAHDQHVDESRPKALRLARKWAKPGEVVLYVHYSPRVSAMFPEELCVVLSRGFAIGGPGAQFRADWDVHQHSLKLDDAAANFESYWAGEDFGSRNINASSPRWMYARVYQTEVAAGSRPAARSLPASKNRARRAPRPQARLIRTARDAELAAAEWMEYLGFTAVTPTPVGADAGVDILSDEALAQVKAETVPTGRPPIQQHHGVCTAAGKEALFFSLAGYTPAAATFADKVGIALFQFNLAAEIAPFNHAAYEVFRHAGVQPPALD
jgi:hypothetical protein